VVRAGTEEVTFSHTIRLQRYYLSLSSYAGIVFNASHWWCRIRWTDENGEDHEADAEHGRGNERSMRFASKSAARAAGLRLVRKLAEGTYYVVTEGSHAAIDPQETLIAPGNLKQRLNTLWKQFEALNGWDGPRSEWPAVQKVCDRWSSLIGARQ
jgi:hypothetical protein